LGLIWPLSCLTQEAEGDQPVISVGATSWLGLPWVLDLCRRPIYIYIPSFCKFENRFSKSRVVVLRDPDRLKATGIFSFQILETLQDYRNLFVFFNTENLKGFLKWLGELEAQVLQKVRTAQRG